MDLARNALSNTATSGKISERNAGIDFWCSCRYEKKSATHSQWVGAELNAENHRLMSILPSLAHGFLVPSPIAEVLYKTADYYHPQSEVWLAWGDLGLGINWPLPDGIEFIMSAKDALGLLPKQPVGNVS